MCSHPSNALALWPWTSLLMDILFQKRFSVPCQGTSVSSTTQYDCFDYYMRRHRKRVGNFFFFYSPNPFSALFCSVPQEADPDKTHPWLLCWLTSLWVWPMGGQQESEDSKRDRQEYFFLLPFLLQCNISRTISVFHSCSFLGSGPSSRALSITKLYNTLSLIFHFSLSGDISPLWPLSGCLNTSYLVC